MLWNCSEVALKLLWRCSEDALKQNSNSWGDPAVALTAGRAWTSYLSSDIQFGCNALYFQRTRYKWIRSKSSIEESSSSTASLLLFTGCTHWARSMPVSNWDRDTSSEGQVSSSVPGFINLRKFSQSWCCIFGGAKNSKTLFRITTSADVTTCG